MWGFIPGGAVIGTARSLGGRGKGRARARAHARSRARWSTPTTARDIVGGVTLMLVTLFIVALFI